MNDRTGTEREKTKTGLKSMRKLRLLLTLTVVPVYYFQAAAGIICGGARAFLIRWNVSQTETGG